MSMWKVRLCSPSPAHQVRSWLFLSIAWVGQALLCQSTPAAPPSSYLTRLSGGHWVTARSIGAESTVLKVRLDADSWEIPLRFSSLSDCIELGSEQLLVCGIAADHSGGLARLSLTGTGLHLEEQASVGSWQPVGVAYSQLLQRVFALSKDGHVLQAPMLGTPFLLPPASAWEVALRAEDSRALRAVRPRVFVTPEGDLGISLTDMGEPLRFRLVGGIWTRQQALPRANAGPRVEVQKPVLLGGGLRLRSRVAGAVVLQQRHRETIQAIGTIEPAQVGQWTQLELPPGLQCGQSYRCVVAGTAASGWFSPSRLTASNWSVASIRLGEIEVSPDLCALNRPMFVFSASVEVIGRDIASLETVALVSTGPRGSAPALRQVGQHSLLRAESVLRLTQSVDLGKRRHYRLAAPVLHGMDAADVGSAVHVQLLVLDGNGVCLGGTGISSIEILPPDPRFGGAIEAKTLEHLRTLWQQRGAADPASVLEAIEATIAR